MAKLKAYIVKENMHMYIEHCVLAENAEQAKSKVLHHGNADGLWSESDHPHKVTLVSVRRFPEEDPE